MLVFLVEGMRLAQIDGQEALGQFDGMKLRSKCLDDHFPVSVRRQTASGCAADAVLAIELHVQGIECMTTGTYGDADSVCILCSVLCVWRRLILRLVELETDLRKIIEFGDGAALDFRRDATFEDTVEQSVDVGFFGEVDEGLCVVRSLHFFEILDNFLERISIIQSSVLEFDHTLSNGSDVNKPISSFSPSVIPYSCGQMKSNKTLASLYNSRSFSSLASVFAFV